MQLIDHGYLLVLSLPRVQQFIAESRRTADLLAGSVIFSDLARQALDTVVRRDPRTRRIMPHLLVDDASADVSNRMVLLLTPELSLDQVKSIARDAVAAVQARWKSLLRETFPENSPSTPGFPHMIWMITEAEDARSYANAWTVATEALAHRKRMRDFTAHTDFGQVCSLTGRWAAVPTPDRALRSRRGEQLSPVCWVKRKHTTSRPFPSTSTLAAASFRTQVAKLLTSGSHPELVRAAQEITSCTRKLAGELGVPLRTSAGSLPSIETSKPNYSQLAWDFLTGFDGSWVYPDSWEPRAAARELDGEADGIEEPLKEICDNGRRAAQCLIEEAARQGVSKPATYVALVAQDADDMGRNLGSGDEVSADWHSTVSEALHASATQQRGLIESTSICGRVVYAGGDDLLALVPVNRAITAALEIRRRFRETVQPALSVTQTASTAIVFFHYSSPLQEAVRCVQRALSEAKSIDPQKNRLAIVVLRRGGERARSYLQWRYPSRDLLPDDLSVLINAFGAGGRLLSPGLIADLENESSGLERLGELERDSEVQRLLRRHWSGGEAERETIGQCLLRLMKGSSVRAEFHHERHGEHAARLAALLQIALFVSGEGR